MTGLIDELVARQPTWQELRRDLHAHPETAYAEHRTAAVVADLLQQWGIEVHTGIGRTGVVGVIRKGTARRGIGLRADMDALPVTETNDVPHVSTTPGAMHACGHDGHTTMLLAAAEHLALRCEFDGAVHLIFQPAEEGNAGARAMIEDGLFDRFTIDEVYALHSWPGLDVGQFGVGPGLAMGSSNRFYLTVNGRGGHAAMPHLNVDPIPIAAEIVQAFQTIVSRTVSPTEPAVVSVTTINGGETTNAIPSSCTLSGTVRTATESAIEQISHRMRQISEQVCRAHGAEADFRFVRTYPPTINPPAQAEFARTVMASVVGEDQVLGHEGAMTGEDFSFMLQQRPGAYAFIGNGGRAALHSSNYDFNDDATAIGATFWVRLVEQFCAR